MQRADLHTHSYYSDGSLSPAALVARAHDAQVTLLALSDHDTIDGVAEARQACAGTPVTLVPAVELSSQWQPVAGRYLASVHVVMLNWQHSEPVQDFLVQQQRRRAIRAEQICARIKTLTKQNIYDDALMLARQRPEAITRSHLGQVMVTRGLVTRQQQAFDLFLGEGKPAHVPLTWASLPEIMTLAVEAQAVTVLAHPTRYGLSATRCRRLIAHFAVIGGTGVELPARNEPPATRAMIDREISSGKLAVSTASDFHGDHMPWARLGQVPELSAGQKPIWDYF